MKIGIKRMKLSRLFSLLARADETLPIIDVIENHRDEEVRLCAVRVLRCRRPDERYLKASRISVARRHSGKCAHGGTRSLYKLDQDQSPSLDLPASDNVPVFLHNSS